LAGLRDDAVERARCGAGRRGLRRVVRPALDHVRQLTEAELEPGRADAVGRLAVQPPVAVVVVGRQLHLLLDRPGWVAEERDFQFLARLAAGGTHARRPGERAAVQPVLTGTVAAVGTLAHLNDVLAVGRDDDRTAAVLPAQR